MTQYKRKRTKKSKTKKRRSQKIVGGDIRFTKKMQDDTKKKVEQINLFNSTDLYYVVLEKREEDLDKALLARNTITCTYKLKPQIAKKKPQIAENKNYLKKMSFFAQKEDGELNIDILEKSDFMTSLHKYHPTYAEEFWKDIQAGDIIVQPGGFGLQWYKPSQDTWRIEKQD